MSVHFQLHDLVLSTDQLFKGAVTGFRKFCMT